MKAILWKIGSENCPVDNIAIKNFKKALKRIHRSNDKNKEIGDIIRYHAVSVKVIDIDVDSNLH